jgi:transcriptional regulator with XRE-family HTH domain
LLIWKVGEEMEIGERIVLLREKKGWKQNEFAEIVNINVSVMNRIEKGTRPITDSEIIKIADALEVSTDLLLGKIPLHNNKINVVGREIALTEEELKIFETLKKHPILFNDLASNPEQKIKELIKLYKMKKMFLDEDEEEYGDGFGDLED